jgi:mono/diheme cytochrome c family protein
MTEGEATVRPNLATLATWLLLAAPAAPVNAQDVGDAVTGRKLAETWCSSCHLVGETHGVVVSNGAPTFAAIAADKSITVLSLRAFLQTPHARMPDLHLSREEVDDLASYILSLRAR